MKEKRVTRGHFLKYGSGALGGAYLASTVGYGVAWARGPKAPSSPPGSGEPKSVESDWREADRILRRIREPKFPNQDYNITDYGAVGDGETDCTEAFQCAIADCSGANEEPGSGPKPGPPGDPKGGPGHTPRPGPKGGRVVIPAGTFLTGAIHLKSNVNLHVTSGATIKFSQDTEDYLPVVYTRFEGTEVRNYSPFIYAYEQENVAITGGGVLDGQADLDHWWPWKGKEEDGWEPGEPNGNDDAARLIELADSGVPVSERIFGDGHYLRPNFIETNRCKNVLIEGVTINRSPMWEIHPVLCENVILRDLVIDSHGPNNDGCDPESCDYVLIEGCTFDTGDDCIAIKAGKNADGRRVDVPCQNLVVQNCEMRDGHGGVTIGSEMTGGVRNVYARDCSCCSPNLDIALRLKTNSVRGGFIENVNMKDCTIGQVADSLLKIDFFYGEGPGGDYLPEVDNIEMRDIDAEEGGEYAFDVVGYDNDPVTDVRIIDTVVGRADAPYEIENAEVLLKNVSINGVIYEDETFNP